MDDGSSFVVEVSEAVWARFAADISDVTPEEADWRPLPQANSINVILRHVRIEAEWHLASLEHGAAMPESISPELQRQIDSVPIDFEQNSKALARLVARFLAVLRQTPLAKLRAQTALAYGADSRAPSIPPHFLGFHQATHLAGHLGQIRTLRNLYRTTRGEAARFHPSNPTYPR
ncbi:MAG: DinB family protein [Vicinamibacterales bacterium]